ncbi:MAG: NYN domain-containing protein [Candidatus Omnitrophica bacterium]|nr:NYN domain-containing protein [Candidatus Omnitrophota bacterium]MBU0878090.1 NYN domain-containing protein [Candidatus Omnitrophota bacterium]MBU0896752.1 NYN domain-containing protein [Candidatus Omnitrophota bacterium]MBU1134671.1 NYN domain-containing protein [Candidatus Omnitrophota bacterium]MBU1367405.1 NYN domain-containing protein [Candidatus Omnitrophota bacterium]
MFNPKTNTIAELAKKVPELIENLKTIFDQPTNVYIDFANVIHWQDKLQWHIDLKRLQQFLDSFTNVKNVNFYYGTLVGNRNSENIIQKTKNRRYNVITKPVKIMRLSIDISSIPLDSTKIIEQFIRPPLLKKLNIETVEFLNRKLQELNKQGVKYLEDRKCNFDVEIGRDMLIDYHENKAQNFILWSGDSDFADPVKQLLSDGRRVSLFITVRKVATELNELKKDGLRIFEIQKIRNFICYKREIRLDKLPIKAKRTQ